MADMNGYMNKFEVNQGNGQKTTDETKTKYFGLGDGVVYEITKSLQGKYHKVCVDNYFTSGLSHRMLVFIRFYVVVYCVPIKSSFLQIYVKIKI